MDAGEKNSEITVNVAEKNGSGFNGTQLNFAS